MYYRIIFHPLFPHSWKNRNQIRGEFSLRVEEGYIPNGPGTFRARKKAAKKSRLQISTRARANEQRDSLESRQANTKRQTYARTYRSSPFLVPASFFSISRREKSRILSRPRGHRFFAHHFVSFFPPRVRACHVYVSLSVCIKVPSLDYRERHRSHLRRFVSAGFCTRRAFRTADAISVSLREYKSPWNSVTS